VQRRWQGAALMSRTAFMRRRMLLTCSVVCQLRGLLLCVVSSCSTTKRAQHCSRCGHHGQHRVESVRLTYRRLLTEQCRPTRRWIASTEGTACRPNCVFEGLTAGRRHSLHYGCDGKGLYSLQSGHTCKTAWTSAGDACLQRRRSSDVTAGNMPGTSPQSSTLQPLLVDISSDQARSTFQSSAAGQLGLHQHTTEG
jgi:ribosomal protein L44E